MPLGDDGYAHRLLFASEVVKEAGRLILSFYRRPEALLAESKGPRDLVTAADHAADALIQSRLAGAVTRS